jgi:hypothetical protein
MRRRVWESRFPKAYGSRRCQILSNPRRHPGDIFQRVVPSSPGADGGTLSARKPGEGTATIAGRRPAPQRVAMA